MRAYAWHSLPCKAAGTAAADSKKKLAAARRERATQCSKLCELESQQREVAREKRELAKAVRRARRQRKRLSKVLDNFSSEELKSLAAAQEALEAGQRLGGEEDAEDEDEDEEGGGGAPDEEQDVRRDHHDHHDPPGGDGITACDLAVCQCKVVFISNTRGVTI